MDHLAPALLIFALRIGDVSIGTLRMLYAMRGRRVLAAVLGLVESGVFIFAISSALTGAAADPLKMVGYAAGFAAGTFVGMTVEGWIASGTILARIISRQQSPELADALRGEGFGVTTVEGRGKELDVLILFVVAPRRRGKDMLRLVTRVEPTAFVTIDPVSEARGGYVPHLVAPTSVRK
jgi:uncharacterized protein YebE (UPF0316 family)